MAPLANSGGGGGGAAHSAAARPRTRTARSLERLMPAPPPPPPPPRWRCWCAADGRGSLARVCAAELAGTALLVLLAPPAPGAAPPAPPAALHAGLLVAALVQCFGSVSGAQLNPCVSLAAWWCGRAGARRAAAEAGAQLAGAALGATLRLALGAPAALTAPRAACPPARAALLEAAATLVLVLANAAQWHARTDPDTWPLRIGCVVAALACFADGWTGASMNPARSFGPALLANRWDSHWVYWAGPLSGACAAVALHRVLRPPLPPPPPPPDKP